MRNRLRAGLWAWGGQKLCDWTFTAQHCAGQVGTISRMERNVTLQKNIALLKGFFSLLFYLPTKVAVIWK